MTQINHKHLLVIRLSALGDVAMTVPVLKALTEHYPNVKITFVSKPFLKPLFENLDQVTFYPAEVKGKHKGLVGLWRLYKELKQHKIDAVADLHNVLRSKILRSLFQISGIQVHFIDKGRKEKKALTSIKNKVFTQLTSTHQRYTDVFNRLGFSVDISNPNFPSKRHLNEDILSITNEKSNVWIGIAPFAQYSSKMYPLELMEEVIKALSKDGQYQLLLFGGGQKESEQLSAIQNKFKNTINLVGKLSLSNELRLISNLDCMISMDSGNAHFAAIYGIPTITIWGATHPYSGFAPFHQPFENSILPDLEKYPNLPCSIYGNKVYPGYEDVMYSIPPEEIIQKVLSILTK